MSKTIQELLDDWVDAMHPYGDYSEQLKLIEKQETDPFQTILPLAMKVSAQTIGLDLVPVKPLPGPNLDLIYVDYRYDGLEKEIIKEEDLNIWDKFSNFQSKLLSYVWSFFSF